MVTDARGREANSARSAGKYVHFSLADVRRALDTDAI